MALRVACRVCIFTTLIPNQIKGVLTIGILIAGRQGKEAARTSGEKERKPTSSG